MNSFMAELRKRTQFEWFENCVFGHYGFGFELPLTTIPTKHGICFTFNMQPAKSMFNLDKWVIKVEPSNAEENYVLRVSKDFHYNNFTMTSGLSFSKKREEPPWKPKMTEDYLSIDFRRKSCNKNDAIIGSDRLIEVDPTIIQYNESNIFQPNDGIRMIVHSPDEYPLNNGQHFYIVYWAKNNLVFYPEMFLIDDELRSWPLEKRNCYLDNEKKLFFFKIYTKSSCEHECLLKEVWMCSFLLDS